MNRIVDSYSTIVDLQNIELIDLTCSFSAIAGAGVAVATLTSILTGYLIKKSKDKIVPGNAASLPTDFAPLY